MKKYIIIVAAGRGNRFGSDLPKQVCMLGQRPVLMHAVIAMARAVPDAELIVVVNDAYRDLWLKMCESAGFASPRLVSGGDTRFQSVKNALDSISADAPADAIVLVHDGARPVVKRDMVRRVVEATVANAAAVPVVPVTDSLREIDADGSSVPFDRSRVVGVQTPQGFRLADLRNAYSHGYTPSMTDDASVWQIAGLPAPALVEGSPLNIKITHPRDIDIADLFINR